MIQRLFRAAFAAALLTAVFGTAGAQAAEKVGPDTCKKCHTAEHGVWEGTPHFTSFKEIHRDKKAKDIVEAIGEKRMKNSETCQTCHYTVIGDKADAGPSCESCHGAAKEWVDIHNDKKNPNAIQDAIAKGMIHSSMIYDIASNCMSCHGLANPALPGDKAATMLENGHPLNPNFELVEYSQGVVRHRFYPPDVQTNQEMSDAQKSIYFLVGQAAALVSATEAISKTDNAKYVEAQNQRIAKAKEVLGGIPEAKDVLANPTDETGRAFFESIKGKDYTAQVGSMLPKKYK